jgi:hypothetical protein
MSPRAAILCDDGDPFTIGGGTPLRRSTLSPSAQRIVVLAPDRGPALSRRDSKAGQE